LLLKVMQIQLVIPRISPVSQHFKQPSNRPGMQNWVFGLLPQLKPQFLHEHRLGEIPLALAVATNITVLIFHLTRVLKLVTTTVFLLAVEMFIN